MTLLSVRDYAWRVGRTPQMIHSYIRDGGIKPTLSEKNGNKKIDPEDPVNLQFEEFCKHMDSAQSGVPLEDDILEDLDLDAMSENGGIRLSAVSKADLDRLKTIEQIRLQKQKTAQARGELVTRVSVQKVFSKLFMIHVNQLRTLDQGLAPVLASVFGNDDPELTVKAGVVVNAEIFKILMQIKRLFNDWLEDHGAEVIEDETFTDDGT